jgi:hypothetical protein
VIYKLLKIKLRLFSVLSLINALMPASAAPIEVWEVKQDTEHIGPITVLLAPDAFKFIGNNGALVITSQKPTWKVVGLNVPENIAFDMSLEEWTRNGLKMFNGRSEMATGSASTYVDPVSKLKLLQRVLPMQGRFYGSNDPAIFRAIKKQELQSMRLRLATNIPVSDEQKKLLQGLYTIPYCGGFPYELSTLTTDGDVTYSYRTKSILKKKVDSSIFKYPVGYKTTRDKFSVVVTTKQKKRFEDFIDAFTEDAADEAKSEKKPDKLPSKLPSKVPSK